MKAASIKEIKEELKSRSPKELLDFCLRLSRFKKENKELLTYLLWEAADENSYIKGIKTEIREDFEQINTQSYYYIKKSVRKILRNIRRHIRYSKKKETEVELLLCFCLELKSMSPSFQNNVSLQNIYARQINLIKKIVEQLHEDLQFDYGNELENLVD